MLMCGINLENIFFHYTNKKNIAKIDKDGLVPQIGDSATGIEITKKSSLLLVQKVYFLFLTLELGG